jgi:formylglycine-generating enzyme required for sulfatase activity
VGSYPANPWGIYDMHGNVWEWCRDWHADYPDQSVTDPIGAAEGADRVIRGGSWSVDAVLCRAAYRHWITPSNRDSRLGFRPAVSPP